MAVTPRMVAQAAVKRDRSRTRTPDKKNPYHDDYVLPGSRGRRGYWKEPNSPNVPRDQYATPFQGGGRWRTREHHLNGKYPGAPV